MRKRTHVMAIELHEEKQALKVYLWTFYITLVLYDLLFYYIYPKFFINQESGFSNSLGYWSYVIFFGLIPISIILIKKEKQTSIKYIYIISYVIFSTINDIIVYWDKISTYTTGSAVELILVLFSPLFINKRFYRFVTISIVVRYIVIGLSLSTVVVIVPIVLIIVLSVIAYILLNRFSSYIKALTTTHEELRHKEKLAFVGQMATTVGHEIKNPLSSLKGFTQLQREKYPEDQYYFSIMDQEIDRINAIANDLLLLGKPKSSHFQKHQIRDIIDYVVSITEQQAKKQNQNIVVEIEDSIPDIYIDENQIKQVFINLIKNGLESMPEGGQLQIKVDCNEESWISVRVIDQGSGISKEDMKHLFEPFFTTKNDGTGLGLMVSRKIIEDHNGKININSEVNKGTTIEVLLPISQKSL